MTASSALTGSVVAITGGARGIGRATAAALAARGARVAIGDLDLDVAQATAREIGGTIQAFSVDVTDSASFALFLAGVEEHLGTLDVLVNNAGIMPVVRQEDEDAATARRILDINVHGVICGSKLALGRMVPRGRGHIVNVASQAGKTGLGGVATYCASKHAVVGYSAALADELHGTGVHVTVVMPAIVRTELSEGLPHPRFLRPIQPEQVAEAIVAALEHPRINVHVPRSGGIVLAVMGLLPIRGRRLLEKLLGMEHGVRRLDPSTRAGYEMRAGREVHGVDDREELTA
jgi:NADP-dependent 3-hydroxy acid dehydrogenase YdfG